MVSINGLPAPNVSNTNRTSKAKKGTGVKKGQETVAKTTKVATAVSNSIRQVDESDLHRAQVEYDLPEGKSRKAMEAYMDVMNRAKKEELAQLLGVDIYI